MAIDPVVTETTYALAAANLGPFATVWPYAERSDVQVWLDTGNGGVRLATPGDYTQADVDPLTAGGTVTLSAALLTAGAWPAGSVVSLLRGTPRGQPSSFGEVDGFTPSVATAALDNSERQVQELAALLARALSFPLGEAGATLPRAARRAGLVVGFDDTGALYLAPADALTAQLALQGPWTTVDAAAGAGTTDLSVIASGNIILTNTGDHSINDFGPAPDGTVKRILIGAGARGVQILQDGDRICGTNGVAYGANMPTGFIDSALNSIPAMPGDVLVVSSLGPIAAGGLTRWQILSYEPHHLFNYGERDGSPSGSQIPPWNQFSIGPRGPGGPNGYPVFDGIGLEWQDGIAKVTLPSLNIRGGDDARGKLFWEIVEGNGLVANAGLTAGGELKPVSAGRLFASYVGPVFWPMIDDPANPGHVRHPGNDIGSGAGHSPSVIFQGLGALRYGLKEAPTEDVSGGAFFFEMCKPGTTSTIQRAAFDSLGNLMLFGPAALEAGIAVQGAWPRDTLFPDNPEKWSAPSGDVNWLTTEGYAPYTVFATDINDANCRNNAAFAARHYGAHDAGLDLGWDTGLGLDSFYTVAGGVRTRVQSFDPATQTIVFPKQPAFKAILSADQLAATGDGTLITVVFDDATVDQSRDYDVATGRFTARRGGIYAFGAGVQLGGVLVANNLFQTNFLRRAPGGALFKQYGPQSWGAVAADAAGDVFLENTLGVVEMNPGDTIEYTLKVSGNAAKNINIVAGASDIQASWFWGRLVA